MEGTATLLLSFSSTVPKAAPKPVTVGEGGWVGRTYSRVSKFVHER